MRLSKVIKILTILTLISIFSQDPLIKIYSQSIDKPTYIFSTKSLVTHACICWDANIEEDLSHYKLYLGHQHDLFDTTVTTVDTFLIVFFSDSLKYDSLFCWVTAFDEAGNESEPSDVITFVPVIVSLDLYNDNNHRIDVHDLRTWLKLYRKFGHKSTFHKLKF